MVTANRIFSMFIIYVPVRSLQPMLSIRVAGLKCISHRHSMQFGTVKLATEAMHKGYTEPIKSAV